MKRKRKSNVFMQQAIDMTKIGIVGSVGQGVVGSLGGLAGPASAPVQKATSAGINLAVIGQMGKGGLTIAKSMKSKKFKW